MFRRIVILLLFAALGGCGSSGRAPLEDRYGSGQSAVSVYNVQRGDTLYSIAFRYGLDYRSNITGGAFDLRAVATVWLASNDHRTSGLTLSSILEKMEIADRFEAHRAVEDARAAAAVLQMHHLGRALV